MPTERNAVKLGTTLIVVFLLFFAILLWLPNTLGAGPTQTLRVRFPQAWPLPSIQDGSKVLVAGRQVGHVTDVELVPMPVRPGAADGPRDLYLVASAKIEKAIELRADCRIRAVGEVLGGGGSLTIDIGASKDKADLAVILEGASPGGFGAYLDSLGRELDANNPSSMLGLVKTQLLSDRPDALMAKLIRSIDDINTITHTLSVQLDAGQKQSMLAKLGRTIDEVNAATTSLREQLEAGRSDGALAKALAALDTLNGGLRSAAAILDENRRPLGDAVRHVSSTAEKLDTRIAESIAQQVDPRNSSGLLTKLHTAMDDLNRALKDITVMTGTTRQVLVLNRENVNQMLLNFKQTSDHLKSAARYILAHPWRLLKEPGATETRQQAIFDAARSFAEAASSLDDATSQLRALSDMHGGAIPTDDPDLPRIQADLRTTFEKFRQAEKTLWNELSVR